MKKGIAIFGSIILAAWIFESRRKASVSVSVCASSTCVASVGPHCIPVVTPPSTCHAGNVSDSIVNGIDQFLAHGGITPTAGGGDRLLNSFVGTDGVTQYTYQRPNGDTYTTTVQNP